MTALKINTRAQIILWLIFALSIALYFAGKQISQDRIQNFVAGAGPWSPLIYILTHQLSYIFAPISGYPFLIVGFYLFGAKTIIYNYIAVLIGATMNFYIAKRWGRPIVEKLAGAESLSQVDKFANEYGVGALLVLRLFFGGFSDFVSYAYGLTTMKFSTYIAVTAIATIPAAILAYFAASRAQNIEQFLGISVAMTFAAGAVFIAGNYVWKKLKAKKYGSRRI